MSNDPSLHEVLLTDSAEQDLADIHGYIATFDSPAQADHVQDGLLAAIEGLAVLPERGSYPKELLALGIKAYRQTFFRPYRVIYRVQHRQVIVYLVADGRRDMESVLARRLLTA